MHAPSGKLRRRAFTLLETMLAAAIGALVVAACLGVFRAVDMHEQRLRARSSQVMGLARLRTVLQRTCSSFAMSDHPRPPPRVIDNAARPGSGTSDTTGAGGALDTRGGAGSRSSGTAGSGGRASSALTGAGGAGASGTSGVDSSPDSRSASVAEALARTRAGLENLAASLPARVTLASDREVAGALMVRPPEAVHTPSAVQRLEVVLTRHPVPTKTYSTPQSEALLADAAAKRASAATQESAAEVSGTSRSKELKTGAPSSGRSGAGGDDSALPESTGGAVRGAFELRPTPLRPGAPFPKIPSWTLYWQPLTPVPERPRGADPQTPLATPEPAGPPVEIVSDLEYFHWQFFRERERRSEHRAVWSDDLPAYVEVEVRTIDGLWANWMFEVDWSVAAEAIAADTSGDKPDGSGSGADSRTGGTRGAPPVPKMTKVRPK